MFRVSSSLSAMKGDQWVLFHQPYLSNSITTLRLYVDTCREPMWRLGIQHREFFDVFDPLHARLGYVRPAAKEDANIQVTGRQRNSRQDNRNQNLPPLTSRQSRQVKGASRRLRDCVLACAVFVLINQRCASYTENIETPGGTERRRKSFDGQRPRPEKTRRPGSRGTGQQRLRAT
ncbi:hypothetical protein T03_11057 [Trichinella britovi]|uniref:Uncharacterized protein n=1 Tax=Trichinella britovi TaxID=45882 RepID=A0A0V1C668_TRIBR|nr:hypothetical protein T03_13648 [Trichinella britovi]KRY50735.1 hypothetical protein T03_11057 [Trichinella britovi]